MIFFLVRENPASTPKPGVNSMCVTEFSQFDLSQYLNTGIYLSLCVEIPGTYRCERFTATIDRRDGYMLYGQRVHRTLWEWICREAHLEPFSIDFTRIRGFDLT
jgi:hypothetical protein